MEGVGRRCIVVATLRPDGCVCVCHVWCVLSVCCVNDMHHVCHVCCMCVMYVACVSCMIHVCHVYYMRHACVVVAALQPDGCVCVCHV